MDKRKQRLVELNEEILTHLLDFRSKNKDFTFSLRDADYIKNKERVDSGVWFKGSSDDGKLLFGFSDIQNGATLTPLLAFVIELGKNGEIKDNYIYSRIETEWREKKVIEDILAEYSIKETKRKNRLVYSKKEDYIANLNDYINNFRNLCLKHLKNNLNKEFFISQDNFANRLDKILKKRIEFKQKNKNNLNKTSEIDAQHNYRENKSPRNLILYGPPGTGKTYNTIERAIIMSNPTFVFPNNGDKNKNRQIVKDEFNRLKKLGYIHFTTFHQSIAYEDFIEGIKPLSPDKEKSSLKYEVVDGLFKKICKDALTPNINDFDNAFQQLINELNNSQNLINLKTPTGKDFFISLNSKGNLNLHTGSNKEKQGTLTKENIQKQILGEEKFIGWEGYFNGVLNYLKSKFGYDNTITESKSYNYVLIIDEINRGNISQIFGELITLIEEDKRIGAKEELNVILPFSREYFGVPNNLYILGTMNTADRSVEALDSALRRRFSFIEMMPDATVIKPALIPNTDINLQQLLTKINERLEVLLSKEHTIGHTYLLGIENINDLKCAFNNKIIPLLKEYFYGDFGKISMVLGNYFVYQEKNAKPQFLGDYKDMIEEYDEALPWKFKTLKFDKSEDMEFIEAVKIIYTTQNKN